VRAGAGITNYDIECSWNQNHEDLTKAHGVPLLLSPGDTAVDPWVAQKGIQSTSHGTSVLGELIADRDTKGVTGSAYGASIGPAPAYTQNHELNVMSCDQSKDLTGSCPKHSRCEVLSCPGAAGNSPTSAPCLHPFQQACQAQSRLDHTMGAALARQEQGVRCRRGDLKPHGLSPADPKSAKA
jgi:hypothetical protein